MEAYTEISVCCFYSILRSANRAIFWKHIPFPCLKRLVAPGLSEDHVQFLQTRKAFSDLARIILHPPFPHLRSPLQAPTTPWVPQEQLRTLHASEGFLMLGALENAVLAWVLWEAELED